MAHRIPVHMLKQGIDPTELPMVDQGRRFSVSSVLLFGGLILCVLCGVWWWFNMGPGKPASALKAPAVAVVTPAITPAGPGLSPSPTVNAWAPYQTVHAQYHPWSSGKTPTTNIASANRPPATPRPSTPGRTYPASGGNVPNNLQRTVIIYRTVVVIITATTRPATPTATPNNVPGPLIYTVYLPLALQAYSAPISYSYTVYLPILAR